MPFMTSFASGNDRRAPQPANSRGFGQTPARFQRAKYMQISLRNDWQNHYRSEHAKIYRAAGLDRELIDQIFDKLHAQERMKRTQFAIMGYQLSLAYTQHLIEDLLRAFREFCRIYVDDGVTFSPTIDTYTYTTSIWYPVRLTRGTWPWTHENAFSVTRMSFLFFRRRENLIVMSLQIHETNM